MNASRKNTLQLIENLSPADTKKFKTYSCLYRSASLFGADSILRTYISCPSHFPIPLSLSHGVDLGQWHHPIDINKIEPGHWCTNRIVYEKSITYKPSVLIPHPWTIICKTLGPTALQQPIQKKSRLIVLPPPGPLNDALVTEWMGLYGYKDDILLVKARGNYQASLRFFHQHGFRTECLSSFDDSYYPLLYSLLLRCHSIVGLTASSLLFFSAFMGVPTSVCKKFTYHACDITSLQNIPDCDWSIFRDFILSCLEGDADASRSIAAFALGEDLWIDDTEKRQASIISFLSSIGYPYSDQLTSSYMPKRLLEAIALLSRRPHFLEHGFRKALKLALAEKLVTENNVRFKLNEIDLILNGASPSNYSCSPIVGGIPGSGF